VGGPSPRPPSAIVEQPKTGQPKANRPKANRPKADQSKADRPGKTAVSIVPAHHRPGWSGRHLAGAWRRTYAITAVLALYLNVFVLIAQLFMKVPALKALAPTQSEAPFKEAQLAALVAFVVLTILAAIRFHSQPVQPAS